ncbi:hypothetical protein L2E82_32592 [Cichorium intybus]|uniref:Uncharacterized protein n=1 Tax=Cichorium intybus TaxID=13427 RepID=A0ACB9BIA2_CICIN|nr:hypothetical protein L2E82_32592 [Cichorium intybus]
MLRLIPTSFLDRASVNQFDYDLRFQVKSIRSIDRALAIQSRSGIRLRFQAIDTIGVGICTSRIAGLIADSGLRTCIAIAIVL